MAADPATTARRQRRFDTYERLSTPPLLINGCLFLGAFMAVLTVPGDVFAPFLLTMTWVVFITDYVLMFCLAPHRWVWAATRAYYLVGLVFPPFRVVLLVQVVDRAMRSRNSPLREKVGLTMAYATTVIVVFGAYFVWQFERGEPHANIRTYGESLWWAVVTITTVGYGDYAPVTVAGRVVATVVLFNGIAAIGVLSGVVVSYFTVDLRNRGHVTDADSLAAADPAQAGGADTQRAPQEPHDPLTAIHQRLARIEAALTGHPAPGSTTPSDPPPTIAGAGGGADAGADEREDRHDRGT